MNAVATPQIRRGRVGAAVWAAHFGKATRAEWRMLSNAGLAAPMDYGRMALTDAARELIASWQQLNREATGARA